MSDGKNSINDWLRASENGEKPKYEDDNSLSTLEMPDELDNEINSNSKTPVTTNGDVTNEHGNNYSKEKNLQINVNPTIIDTPNGTQSDDAKTNEEASPEAAGALVEDPPDGGWGWVVVAVSFLNYLLLPGLLRSYGVLHLNILAAFPHSTATEASWIPALLSTLSNALAPVSSALCEKFSMAKTVALGGVLCSIGLISSFFATSVIYLAITLGAILGAGSGLCITPGILLTARYFKKRRALANGFCVAGSSVGSFVLPPLVEVLCEEYSYRGALLILGGLTLNLIVLAYVFRPPEYFAKRRHRKQMNKTNEAGKKKNTTFIETIKQDIGNGERSKPSHPVVTTSKEIIIFPPNEARNGVVLRSFRNISDDVNSNYILNRNTNYEKKLQNGEILKNSAIFDISSKATQSSPSMETPTESKAVEQQGKRKFKYFLDWSLLKNPVFVVTVVSGALYRVSVPQALFYFPAQANILGIGKREAAALLSINAVCDLIGRMGFGWISDKQYFKRIHGFSLTILVAATGILILPFTSSYLGMMASSILFGLGAGSSIILVPVILADHHGSKNLPSSLGIVRIFQAAMTFVAPVVTGVLKDSTGQYAAAYILMAACLIGAAITIQLTPLAHKYNDTKDSATSKA